MKKITIMPNTNLVPITDKRSRAKRRLKPIASRKAELHLQRMEIAVFEDFDNVTELWELDLAKLSVSPDEPTIQSWPVTPPLYLRGRELEIWEKTGGLPCPRE